MLTVVAFSFALAVVAPWIIKVGRAFTGWLLAAAPLGMTVYFTTQIPRIARGETITESYPWAPTLGINLSFYLDGLSLLFALLVTPAVSAISSVVNPVTLTLWHGFNLPLLISVISVVAGLTLFAVWTPLRQRTQGFVAVFDNGPARGYQAGLDGLNAVARWQTRVLQSGYLRFYLMTIIVATMVLMTYAYTSRATFPGLPESSSIGAPELTLAALIVLGAFATANAPSRLSSVAALGVVGYGVALMYILYGAPDLAMTQFMTETLTVILFVFVFYHLPCFARLSSTSSRWRDIAIAAAFGTLMIGLVLAATAIPLDSQLQNFYAQNSLSLGHGRNRAAHCGDERPDTDAA